MASQLQAATALIQRQLEFWEPTGHEIIYGPLSAMDFHLPTAGNAPRGADRYVTWFQDYTATVTPYGAGQTDYSQPTFSADGYYTNIARYASAVTWDVTDQWAEDMARQMNNVGPSVPLISTLMEANEQGHKNKWNQILISGDEATGLNGILSLSTISSTSGPAPWNDPATTGESIVNQVLGLVATIIQDSRTVIEPNLVLLPPQEMQLIKRTPYSTTFPNVTIYQWMKDNYPSLEFRQVPEFTNAAPDGGDILVVMYYGRYRGKPILAVDFPVPYMMGAAHPYDFKVKTATMSSLTGSIAPYPFAIRKLTNIWDYEA